MLKIIIEYVHSRYFICFELNTKYNTFETFFISLSHSFYASIIDNFKQTENRQLCHFLNEGTDSYYVGVLSSEAIVIIIIKKKNSDALPYQDMSPSKRRMM